MNDNQNNKVVVRKCGGVFVNAVGWILLLGFLYFAWTKIYPIILRIDNLTSLTGGVVNSAGRGVNEANELIDKVNHQIKNIGKFNPF